MKMSWTMRIWNRAVAAGLVLLLSAATSFGAEATARITGVRIEKAQVVVDVEAAGELAKVTLESSPRVGRRAWEPRAVKLLDGSEAAEGLVKFSFTVPLSPAVEILRVRGDLAAGALPSIFYGGTNKFNAGANGGNMAAGPTAQVVDRAAEDGAGAPREVAESDIWKLEGDTLYFFNQYRGLQMLDVANPDAPVLTGTYDLAASGEQMYVLDGAKVALLARDNCAWWADGNQSRVMLLEVKNGAPSLVKELAVPGTISESRMVGTALYVVANNYQRRALAGGGEEWTWGSEILSFDLSDFANAQEKSRAWVKGYGNAIYATDKFLFVAQTDYNVWPATESIVHCFDVSAPDGTFEEKSTFGAGGVVQDKFKMHLNGSVFYAVVQQQDANRGRVVRVNSFSLEDALKPVKLGELKIIDNEQLFATRFDKGRLYAVTFFVIDPLWIIDLSDPAAMKITGELEIPGWSTYLRPMGDKLLAIGLDRTNGFQKTAVQLFDVANPAKPALLSKVFIGEQWSGSEANWDEKAFGVLPEEKLLLVPFSAGGETGWTEGVQLIDLEADHLVKRGVIEHKMGARRATLHKERILSISSRELLTVNASNRDKPELVKSTELSWAADRVHAAGNHVVEVDANSSDGPVLRVVGAENGNEVLRTVPLGKLTYMGSTAIEGKLHVLQGRNVEFIYPEKPANEVNGPIATNPAVYALTVFDLSKLPELPVLSETTQESTNTGYFYGQYKAVTPKAGVVVWASKNSGGYPWWRWGGIMVDTVMPLRASASIIADRGGPIWWGGGAGHFIAYDVSAEKPKFASEITLSSAEGWWNFSESFGTDGLIYTSHQANEFDPTVDPPPQAWDCWDNGRMTVCTNDPPPGVWVTRYYLDVIDYADPKDPVARKPANIPGSLIGIHRGGELLYTRGYEMGPSYYQGGEEKLQASAYDGVQAHLITSMTLSNIWPQPSLVDRGFVYLGKPPTDNQAKAALQTWVLGNGGKFELTGSMALGSPAQELRSFGALLAAQGSQIQLLDATDPSNLELAGEGRASACYGIALDAADGDLNRGLWVPIGWYGVVKISLTGKEQR